MVETTQVWIDEESEAVIPIANGEFLCFQGYEENKEGTEYVRVVDAEGDELVFYHWSEWCADPVGTMGSILGLALLGAGVIITNMEEARA